ncbi:Binding partner of ACD11 1 [Camellia lanceoleosa]|uniref:Binding partner of ACD11 1 n=1 Tax=Camellia lanceoleosa TaxID=1840588 RepID=A0ACC0G309_9ERIC|nr:Binding partner of ACD11 1 [Camellia lanceoleosa]
MSNVSLRATEQDIKEFFSFSGDIEYVEMQSKTEQSQIAFVTFKDSQGAETAVLLSGATIVDLSVTVTLDPDYQLPPGASAPPLKTGNKTAGSSESAFRKAEDVVSSMLAKGFVLGKDAVNKAKSFDEKHQLTSTTTAKVASFDKKIGLSQKISIGTSAVNDKVRSRSEISSAFNKVAMAAGEVGQKTKEKVERLKRSRKENGDDYAEIHVSEPPKGSAPNEQQSSKPAPAQGLIL